MKVCVLGSNGFIGKNLVTKTNWIGVTRRDVDLLNQMAVEEYFNTHDYDVVVHCAATIDQTSESTTYKNIMMFENVVRVFKGKILYFSSGAGLRGNPPTDPYGLSKWIIDQRILTLPNAHTLRVWGCYGSGELSSRLSSVCKRDGHVVIKKDKWFDYVHIDEVCKIVQEYVDNKRNDKETDISGERRLLSEWAQYFGATYKIQDTSGLDEPYISSTRDSF